MGKIIAVANQKGGVGKTTTAINLAASLAEAGQRVLLLDFDPQGNATSGFGLEEEDFAATIYEVITGKSKLADAILQEVVKGLDLVPSDMDLAAADVEFVDVGNKNYVLREALLPFKERYDYLLVDCPPSLGMLTVNALTAANGVIIPVETEFFALRGVALLMQSIEKVQTRINAGLKVFGVLPTMYTRTLHSAEVLQRIYEAFGETVFHTVISRSVKLPDATVAAAPITVFAPEHKVAKEYSEATREIIARGIVA